MSTRMELMDIKERENAVCKRCGEHRSVKYRIGDKTYCNKCAPIILFNHQEEYDDDFDMTIREDWNVT